MPIRVALFGVGNCASSLVQGLEYYKGLTAESPPAAGLMHNELCGYRIADIEIVAAFDVNKNKVGKDVTRAIFVKPNNASVFSRPPKKGVAVSAGFLGDGIAARLQNCFPLTNKSESIVDVLKQSRAEIAINFLPTGSKETTRFYAEACLDARVALINGIPEFIASDPAWVKKFEKAGLPCAGDDVMSQVGATIVNCALLELVRSRGQTVEQVVQLNRGNNMDFQNLCQVERIDSKMVSKAVPLVLRAGTNNILAGPADFDPTLRPDEKVAHITIAGQQFGGRRYRLSAKLSVEDSPNSAGTIVDAIRLMKVSLDRNLTGYQEWSAYFFKHPLMPLSLERGRELVETFAARGERKNPDV